LSDRLAAAQAYVAQKPTDRFGLYALAMELRKTGAHDDCFAAFDALLQHHPRNGAGYYHYGMARKESGDSQGAREVWERGLVACATADPHAVAEITEALELLADE
jgi:cytochrome c-type biogenesis protein CcmH/NrfG